MSADDYSGAATPGEVDSGILTRILAEGYGPGAWHGPDLKASISDVSTDLAFWRLSPDRHNIAEIVVHHAYQVHSVRERLITEPVDPFPLEGDDWFQLSGTDDGLSWPQILVLIDSEYQELAALVGDLAEGKVVSALPEKDVFNLVLGITCHAVYHAGQIQLLKLQALGEA